MVRHSRGAYEVRFGALESLVERFPHALVLTDGNVADAWGTSLAGLETMRVPPGEASKRVDVWVQVLQWLCDRQASRQSVLIALGGGVVGDLGGFVAATYMRGLRFVQAPTSLMAQVDSSIGGKVGINLDYVKNLVGAFWPPIEVLVDVRTLETLPVEEFVNGAAEIWKYAFIADEALLGRLLHAPLDRSSPDLDAIIARCIEIKAGIVEADEYETGELRAILNFGHTIGHALERVTQHALRHGEAISIGMVHEAILGERLGITPPGIRAQVEGGLQSQGLPVSLPPVNRERLLEAMRIDKKADAGGLAFSLLTALGGCKLVRNVPEHQVLAVLQHR